MGNPQIPVTDTRGSVQHALEEARAGLTRRQDPGSRRNLQSEIAGEAAARRWVEVTYPREDIISEVKVPRRGESGPAIFDVVYELRSQRTSESRFLVIEAKGGSSRLAELKENIFQVDAQGNIHVAPKALSYEQLSPTWLDKRFSELDKRKGHRGLGTRLRAAAGKGQLGVYAVYAPNLPGKPGKRTDMPRVDIEHFVVEDHTAATTEYFKNQARGTAERGLAVPAADAAVHTTRVPAPQAPSSADPVTVRPVIPVAEHADSGHPGRPGVISAEHVQVPTSTRSTSTRSTSTRSTSTRSTGGSSVDREKLLERISTRELRVEAEAGEHIRVIVRGARVIRRVVVAVGVAVLPAVVTGVLQRGLESRVREAVEQGLAWLQITFPPGRIVEGRLVTKSTRGGYQVAEAFFDRNGPRFMDFFEDPGNRGSNDWREIHDHFRSSFLVIDHYIEASGQTYEQCQAFIDELTPIFENLTTYTEALHDLSQELENMAAAALAFPYGDTVGAELESWSLFVDGIAGEAGGLSSEANSLLNQYAAVQADANENIMRANDLKDMWLDLFLNAGGTLDHPLTSV